MVPAVRALETATPASLRQLALFSGPPFGVGMLSAGLILAIMILPIVSAVSREVIATVPSEHKEGALALGATRWEMIRGVVFPYARGGIAAALMLGLGRAVGEAIAVTQVIGGGVFIHWNLFELQSRARAIAGRNPGRDEEWAFLFLYLREFSDSSGQLPVDFDGLVRESFADLIRAA